MARKKGARGVLQCKHKFTTGNTAMNGMETSIRNSSSSQKGQIYWVFSVSPLHPPLPHPPWLPSNTYQLRDGTWTGCLVWKKGLLWSSTSSECAGFYPGKTSSFLNNNVTSFWVVNKKRVWRGNERIFLFSLLNESITIKALSNLQ